MMYIPIILIVAAVSFPSVLSQDLSVPPTWRVSCRPLEFKAKIITSYQKDDTSLAHADRISIAQGGINQILPQLDTSLGEFSGMARLYSNGRNCVKSLDMKVLDTGNRVIFGRQWL